MENTTKDGLLTTQEAADHVGVTYRMLDYWVRVGIIVPYQEANGSGSRRRFSQSDLVCLAMIAECREHLMLDHIAQWFADDDVRQRLDGFMWAFQQPKLANWAAVILRGSSMHPEFITDPFELFGAAETLVVIPMPVVLKRAGL